MRRTTAVSVLNHCAPVSNTFLRSTAGGLPSRRFDIAAQSNVCTRTKRGEHYGSVRGNAMARVRHSLVLNPLRSTMRASHTNPALPPLFGRHSAYAFVAEIRVVNESNC